MVTMGIGHRNSQGLLRGMRRATALLVTAVVITGVGVGTAAAQSPSSVNGHGAAVDTSAGFSWRVTNTGSTEQFRGLAAVNASVA